MTFRPLIWYAAYTAYRAEKRASESLVFALYEVYVPKTKVFVTHARKTEAVERPLFPRYVFFGVPDGDDIYDAKKAEGVDHIVSIAGRPLRLDARDLDRLREWEANGDFDMTKPKPVEPFEEGQMVRITAGDFADLWAEIVGISGERVDVHILTPLGARAALDAKDLEAA